MEQDRGRSAMIFILVMVPVLLLVGHLISQEPLPPKRDDPPPPPRPANWWRK